MNSHDIDAVIERYQHKPGSLLGMLEELQELNEHKYLPPEVLTYLAGKTGIPLSQIYSVVTFYAFFNLKPQGEHSVVVCRGTACHTRRSKELLSYLEKLLCLSEDDRHEGEKLFLTTPDKKFTLKTVACFGQCALAPVVEVDGVIHSHMNEHKLKRIIGAITHQKKRAVKR